MKNRFKLFLILSMFLAAITYQLGFNEEIWIWVLVIGFLLEIYEN